MYGLCAAIALISIQYKWMLSYISLISLN